MRLGVYSNYKLNVKLRSATQVAVNDFYEQEYEQVYEKMSGDQVVEFILASVKDSDFWDIDISDNKIVVEGFNPNTGEDYTKEIHITKLDDDKLPF